MIFSHWVPELGHISCCFGLQGCNKNSICWKNLQTLSIKSKWQWHKQWDNIHTSVTLSTYKVCPESQLTNVMPCPLPYSAKCIGAFIVVLWRGLLCCYVNTLQGRKKRWLHLCCEHPVEAEITRHQQCHSFCLQKTLKKPCIQTLITSGCWATPSCFGNKMRCSFVAKSQSTP